MDQSAAAAAAEEDVGAAGPIVDGTVAPNQADAAPNGENASRNEPSNEAAANSAAAVSDLQDTNHLDGSAPAPLTGQHAIAHESIEGLLSSDSNAPGDQSNAPASDAAAAAGDEEVKIDEEEGEQDVTPDEVHTAFLPDVLVQHLNLDINLLKRRIDGSTTMFCIIPAHAETIRLHARSLRIHSASIGGQKVRWRFRSGVSTVLPSVADHRRDLDTHSAAYRMFLARCAEGELELQVPAGVDGVLTSCDGVSYRAVSVELRWHLLGRDCRGPAWFTERGGGSRWFYAVGDAKKSGTVSSGGGGPRSWFPCVDRSTTRTVFETRLRCVDGSGFGAGDYLGSGEDGWHKFRTPIPIPASCVGVVAWTDSEWVDGGWLSPARRAPVGEPPAIRECVVAAVAAAAYARDARRGKDKVASSDDIQREAENAVDALWRDEPPRRIPRLARGAWVERLVECARVWSQEEKSCTESLRASARSAASAARLDDSQAPTLGLFVEAPGDDVADGETAAKEAEIRAGLDILAGAAQGAKGTKKWAAFAQNTSTPLSNAWLAHRVSLGTATDPSDTPLTAENTLDPPHAARAEERLAAPDAASIADVARGVKWTPDLDCGGGATQPHRLPTLASADALTSRLVQITKPKSSSTSKQSKDSEESKDQQQENAEEEEEDEDEEEEDEDEEEEEEEEDDDDEFFKKVEKKKVAFEADADEDEEGAKGLGGFEEEDDLEEEEEEEDLEEDDDDLEEEDDMEEEEEEDEEDEEEDEAEAEDAANLRLHGTVEASEAFRALGRAVVAAEQAGKEFGGSLSMSESSKRTVSRATEVLSRVRSAALSVAASCEDEEVEARCAVSLWPLARLSAGSVMSVTAAAGGLMGVGGMITFMEEWLGAAYPFRKQWQAVVPGFVSPRVNAPSGFARSLGDVAEGSLPEGDVAGFAGGCVLGTGVLNSGRTPESALESRLAQALGLATGWLSSVLPVHSWRDEWILRGLAGFLALQWLRTAAGEAEYRYRLWAMMRRAAAVEESRPSVGPLAPAARRKHVAQGSDPSRLIAAAAETAAALAVPVDLPAFSAGVTSAAAQLHHDPTALERGWDDGGDLSAFRDPAARDAMLASKAPVVMHCLAETTGLRSMRLAIQGLLRVHTAAAARRGRTAMRFEALLSGGGMDLSLDETGEDTALEAIGVRALTTDDLSRAVMAQHQTEAMRESLRHFILRFIRSAGIPRIIVRAEYLNKDAQLSVMIEQPVRPGAKLYRGPLPVRIHEQRQVVDKIDTLEPREVVCNINPYEDRGRRITGDRPGPKAKTDMARRSKVPLYKDLQSRHMQVFFFKMRGWVKPYKERIATGHHLTQEKGGSTRKRGRYRQRIRERPDRDENNDTPFLYARVDPRLTFPHSVALLGAPHMWKEMLDFDDDIIAHLDAVNSLGEVATRALANDVALKVFTARIQTPPEGSVAVSQQVACLGRLLGVIANEGNRYHHRVRAAAALAVARWQCARSPMPNACPGPERRNQGWIGLEGMLRLYRQLFWDARANTPLVQRAMMVPALRPRRRMNRVPNTLVLREFSERATMLQRYLQHRFKSDVVSAADVADFVTCQFIPRHLRPLVHLVAPRRAPVTPRLDAVRSALALGIAKVRHADGSTPMVVIRFLLGLWRGHCAAGSLLDDAPHLVSLVRGLASAVADLPSGCSLRAGRASRDGIADELARHDDVTPEARLVAPWAPLHTASAGSSAEPAWSRQWVDASHRADEIGAIRAERVAEARRARNKDDVTWIPPWDRESRARGQEAAPLEDDTDAPHSSDDLYKERFGLAARPFTDACGSMRFIAAATPAELVPERSELALAAGALRALRSALAHVPVADPSTSGAVAAAAAQALASLESYGWTAVLDLAVSRAARPPRDAPMLVRPAPIESLLSPDPATFSPLRLRLAAFRASAIRSVRPGPPSLPRELRFLRRRTESALSLPDVPGEELVRVADTVSFASASTAARAVRHCAGDAAWKEASTRLAAYRWATHAAPWLRSVEWTLNVATSDPDPRFRAAALEILLDLHRDTDTAAKLTRRQTHRAGLPRSHTCDTPLLWSRVTNSHRRVLGPLGDGPVHRGCLHPLQSPTGTVMLLYVVLAVAADHPEDVHFDSTVAVLRGRKPSQSVHGEGDGDGMPNVSTAATQASSSVSAAMPPLTLRATSAQSLGTMPMLTPTNTPVPSIGGFASTSDVVSAADAPLRPPTGAASSSAATVGSQGRPPAGPVQDVPVSTTAGFSAAMDTASVTFASMPHAAGASSVAATVGERDSVISAPPATSLALGQNVQSLTNASVPPASSAIAPPPLPQNIPSASSAAAEEQGRQSPGMGDAPVTEKERLAAEYVVRTGQEGVASARQGLLAASSCVDRLHTLFHLPRTNGGRTPPEAIDPIISGIACQLWHSIWGRSPPLPSLLLIGPERTDPSQPPQHPVPTNVTDPFQDHALTEMVRSLANDRDLRAVRIIQLERNAVDPIVKDLQTNAGHALVDAIHKEEEEEEEEELDRDVRMTNIRLRIQADSRKSAAAPASSSEQNGATEAEMNPPMAKRPRMDF